MPPRSLFPPAVDPVSYPITSAVVVGGGKEEGDGGVGGGGFERGTPAAALASPGTFQRWMLEATR